jgi:hypothetical protein
MQQAELCLQTKQAELCLQTNTVHDKPEVRLHMAFQLMQFKPVNAPSAYSTIVKMASLAPKLIEDNFQELSKFISSYVHLVAYIKDQMQYPNVARAFRLFQIAFATHFGSNSVSGKANIRRDAYPYRIIGSLAIVRVVRSLAVVRTQFAGHCPHDALSDFDNQPLWRAIVYGQLRFYMRDGELVLRSPDEVEMEASLAAELLLQEEDDAKATANAAPSSSKAAKRRARQKQKKEEGRLVPLEAIGEDEQVVTPVAEEAAPPTATDDASAAPAPDAGVFNLSDIGSALTSKQDDDAATSVATALMCVVCYSKERNIACVPCGHKCLCEDCGTKENMATDKGCFCPMCREEVMMFMKVFD